MFNMKKMNKYQTRAGVILLALMIILLPFLNDRINPLPLLIIYLTVYCVVIYALGKVMNRRDYSNH